MNPLAEILGRRGRVVLDGGLATALEEDGHDLGTRLWSARLLRDDPEAIRRVHRAYLEAGADVILTASYQASVPGFTEAGLAPDEAEALLVRSIDLALEARDLFWEAEDGSTDRERPLVAASVGPYGAYLADGSEYDGRYDVDAASLRAFHAPRYGLLAGAGPELMACETIPSGVEAEVLLDVVAAESDRWAWLSFSCRDGGHLWDGTPIDEVAHACDAAERVAAVGVNCTAPVHVAELLSRISEVTELPLIAYPNSGEVYDGVSKSWSGSPTAWLDGADWLDRAEVVGGCCRVGPSAIARLRREVAERTGSHGS